MNDKAAAPPLGASWWPWAAAILLWLAVLWAISLYLANNTPVTPPAPPPLDARIIELPPVKPATHPAMASPSKQVRAAAPARPVPHAPEPVQHRMTKPDTPTAAAQAPPSPTAPPKSETVPLKPPAPPAPQQPATKSLSAETGTQSLGAHAIYQPNPVLPEDLRDETLHVDIVARFHIAEDGSVTVELIKAAPDPRVNQIILNTLKTWRFFPATQADKPVSSTQDVNISIDVGD